jgi:hypothetical protein
MKKILLIGLPLLVSACTTDVHSYIPGVSTPTPYYYGGQYHQQPYQSGRSYQQLYNNKHHDHDYNEHHDNGKHKGQYKNKHKHHDD